MTWNIVLDSSCDLLPQHSLKNAQLKIAPLTIRVADREYVDDETIDVMAMLDDMNNEKSASSTACPSPQAFAQHFEDADNVICITISKNLSGTYNAAEMAARMVKEEHPEKNICVIDSYATAGEMVLMARLADKLIGEGKSFGEICETVTAYRDEAKTVFTLMQYDNLIKAGRMKPLVGKVITALGIRVIAQGSDIGTIEVLYKTRGEEANLKKVVEHMCETKDVTNKPVVISHCNNPSGVEKLKALIKEMCHTEDITVLHCKGLTTFYAMEKGLIVGY